MPIKRNTNISNEITAAMLLTLKDSRITLMTVDTLTSNKQTRPDDVPITSCLVSRPLPNSHILFIVHDPSCVDTPKCHAASLSPVRRLNTSSAAPFATQPYDPSTS